LGSFFELWPLYDPQHRFQQRFQRRGSTSKSATTKNETMSHGAAFFTFYIVLVHATCAWLPLPRIPRDISATSRTMYSMRGLHRPKLSLRFDSNEENIAITRRTTKDSSKLGRASKRSVQQPSKVSTVESGQSNFFPWVDRKSNEMSVSTVPAVSDSTRMDADDAQRSLPNSIVAGLIAIIVGGVIASNYFDNVRFVWILLTLKDFVSFLVD